MPRSSEGRSRPRSSRSSTAKERFGYLSVVDPRCLIATSPANEGCPMKFRPSRAKTCKKAGEKRVGLTTPVKVSIITIGRSESNRSRSGSTMT